MSTGKPTRYSGTSGKFSLSKAGFQVAKVEETVALRILQFLILPVDLLLLIYAVTSLINLYVYKFDLTSSYLIQVSQLRSYDVLN